jgi:hypothetical protein
MSTLFRRLAWFGLIYLSSVASFTLITLLVRGILRLLSTR